MGALALKETAHPPAPLSAHSHPRLFKPSGSTLEDVILGVWEDLEGDGQAECPVCRAALAADGCAGCGAQLD